MASDQMVTAALGRPFTLGMLYDARKDVLIPGLTLWHAKTLAENTTQNLSFGSKFNISASDSIESKSTLLDVDASLKASFLGGLIEVGGSAKYLNDQKKSHNQSRVTCQYNATTKFKQLLMKDLLTLDIQQKNVLKKSSATHVVTGILYGANAFFVFDSEKLDTNSIQDIQGHMEAVIRKIPSLNIEGNVDIKLTDEEKALTQKFSCKFYGDFILDNNPTTFEEAVKTYGQLPKLLGEDKENSVPLKIWLMPLNDLDSEAPEVINGISLGLVGKAQDAVEDLKKIRMRCNDSLEDRVVQNFPQIREELSTFHKMCGYYESNLQQTMAEKIPSIRDGTEKESSLGKLFKDRDKSPFSHDKLTKWMDDKEREINIIRSCVDTMEGTKIVPNQNELDKQVLAPGVQHALCFVFTSLETPDPYLDALTKYLDTFEPGSTTREEPWYFSDKVFKTMREKAKTFSYVATLQKNNNRFLFLITSIANEKYTGATLYHYKDGIQVSKDASTSDLVPDLPRVEKITDRRGLMWYATDLTLDPNTANNKLILSEGNKKATHGEWQSYPDHPERFDPRPQVLCKEGLTGRHYWEVEWSTSSYEAVFVAVVYQGIGRKRDIKTSNIGASDESWSVGQYKKSDHTVFEAWHGGNVWKSPLPSMGCSKVGVYLDWPADTLSYYNVSANTLTHIYTHKTKFTEPVYPGFNIVYKTNFVYLSPLEKEW